MAKGSAGAGDRAGQRGGFGRIVWLLWPYVQGRLSKLDQAEATYKSTSTNVWNKYLQVSMGEEGTGLLLYEIRGSTGEPAVELVDQYLDQAVKNDPAYAGAQGNWNRPRRWCRWRWSWGS